MSTGTVKTSPIRLITFCDAREYSSVLFLRVDYNCQADCDYTWLIKMDLILYISFILASILLIVVPGPNVLVIISTSISHGTQRGLQTVIGTSSAMSIQLFIAAMGTTWMVESLSKGFEWLRWLGVGYLIYLGIMHFQKLLKDTSSQLEISASRSFGRGFIISLTNPKTILFFGAFLPQFVSSGSDYMTQITILSATFLLLATILDGLYALFAGRVSHLLQTRQLQNFQNGISGLLFFSAGIWLAILRKS